MKILFYIVLLLLVSQFCHSADFLDDLDEVTQLVYQNLGLKGSTSEIDDSTIHKHIKSAYAVLVATGAREWRDSIITVQYQADYTIDSQLIQIMSVYWHHMDTIKGLSEVAPGQLDTLLKTKRTLKGKVKILARPNYFRWVNGRITLFPVPFLANDTFIIDGLAKVEDLDTSTTFPAEVLVTYRPMITAYATKLAALSLNDFQKAQLWHQVFTEQAQLLGISVGTGIKVD